jgi:hypothetical protein
MQILNPRGATDPPRRSRPRVLRAGLLAGAIVAAVLIAGCGGSSSGGGVAHINSSTSAAKSSTKSNGKPNEIAFSQCMRSHGVPNYPDPNSSGEILLTPSVDAGSPAFQTASNDCKSLKPAGYQTPAQQSKLVAAMLKLAVCMRAHGVPNMPDPTRGGNGGVAFPAGGAVDPHSPAFQRALHECGGLPKPSKSGGG